MTARSRRFLSLVAMTTALLTLTACNGVGFDFGSLPGRARGASNDRITRATYSAFRSGDSTGNFRINCSFSHVSLDDPIVAPGQRFVSHLHSYFGNTQVNGHTTTAQLLTSGNSTCTGGTLDRSSYWAPSVIDARSGELAQPWGENGLQVYYKTGYQGADPARIQPLPNGLKVIAGNSRSTRAQDHVKYSCEGSRPVSAQSSFPRCAPGDRLLMAVEFPGCWDGRNLDSPNHKSHMAYGEWGRGCPSTHPVALPVVTQNYRYVVPSGGMANWRLSSDMYEGAAGYSGHADLWVSWDKGIMDRIVKNCLRTRMDCQMNLLNDGYMLY